MHPISDITKPLNTVRSAPSSVETRLEYLDQGAVPYVANERVCTPAKHLLVHILGEGAQSIVYLTCVKCPGVCPFRTRQECKFGVELNVSSRQGYTTNTEIFARLNAKPSLACGNAHERRDVMHAAASDIGEFAWGIEVRSCDLFEGYHGR